MSSNQSQEEFYNAVRKRTAKRFHDSLRLDKEVDEETEKLLNKYKKRSGSPYSFTNVLWLLVSIAVFYLTDFALVVLYDKRIDRQWLYSGYIGLLISTLCCFYCIVWLSWIKKVKNDDWEAHNPFVIPVATAAGLVGFVLVTCGIWPVWGVFTIPIVGTQAMGFVVFIAMLPDIF